MVLKTKNSRANYPQRCARCTLWSRVDGKEREMEVLTNNLQWSASLAAGKIILRQLLSPVHVSIIF